MSIKKKKKKKNHILTQKTFFKKNHKNKKKKKNKATTKKKRTRQCRKKRKKSVKKSKVGEGVIIHGHFCSNVMPNYSLQFSLHFEEKTFWWVKRENIWTSPFIFLPLHPTKHTLKKFSFSFSLQSFSSTVFHLQTNTP